MKSRRLPARLALLDRPALALPFREAAVEDPDLADAEGAQGPPDPRRGEQAVRVVDDEMHAVAEAERRHLHRETVRVRQHVRAGRSLCPR